MPGGLRPECAALHATDQLVALGRAGIMADAFVSAADGTMPSLATLITGLPDTGVHVNYQPASETHVVPKRSEHSAASRIFEMQDCVVSPPTATSITS